MNCKMWGEDLAMCEIRVVDKKNDCSNCLNMDCSFNSIYDKDGDYLKKEVDKTK